MRTSLAAVLLIFLALPASAQVEEEDAAASTALRPQPGGPSTVGDPVRVTNLSVMHEETDFVIRTGLGDVAIVRKYSGFSISWAEPQWFGAETLFGLYPGHITWWSSLSSYVVESWHPGNRTGKAPGTVLSIRDPSGTLIRPAEIFGPPLRGAITIGGGNGTRISRSADGSRWVLIRPGEGRYMYVLHDSKTNPSGTIRRFKLNAIYPDRYATGHALCSFTYPVGSARMSGANCFGGMRLDVVWTNGKVSELRYGKAGATTAVVKYSYSGGDLAVEDEVGNLSEFTAASGSFAIRRGVGTAGGPKDVRLASLKTIAGAGPQYCENSWVKMWSARGHAVSSERSSTGSVTYTPSPVMPNCSDPLTTWAAEATPSGQTITRTFHSNRQYGHTSYLSIDCMEGQLSCVSVPSANAHWSVNPLLPEPTTTLYRDFRGNYTKTDAVRKCHVPAVCDPNWPNPIETTEITARHSGASDAAGANALKVETMTWQYANTRSFDQLPETLTRPSVLKPGDQARTTWKFDLATKRPTAVFHTGFTRDVAGQIRPRIVATFFYNRSVCTGSPADPLDRTVEVHGPCEVTNTSDGQCPARQDEFVPVTQFSYYDAGLSSFAAGRLAKKRVATAATSSTSCGTNWLETSYDNYDKRGHVLKETDPNSALTLRAYQGDRLLAEGVTGSPNSSGATTRYYYHPSQGGQVSAKRLPSGVWEKYCYRTNTNADCTTGTLVPTLQWKARAVGPDPSKEPVGSNQPLTYSDRTTYSYAQGAGGLPGGGVVVREHAESVTYPLEQKIAGYVYDGLGRVVVNQVLNPTGSVNYEAPSLFDPNGNLLAAGDAWNQPLRLCGADLPAGPGRPPVADMCAHHEYDRLNRLSKTTSPTGVETTFHYDDHGNVDGVTQTPGGQGAQAFQVAQYVHDDFGNVVGVAVGTQSHVFQEFDARGNLRKRQSQSRALVEYRFDGLNRPLDARTSATTLWAYGYDQSTPAWSNCPSGANAVTRGRAQWKDDSFGRTWYTYDALGQVMSLRRVRAGGKACSAPGAASADATPDTEYRYFNDGRLMGMKYPHGRWLRYTYGAGADADRVVKIETNLVGFADAAATFNGIPVVENVRYGIDGAVIGYDTGGSVPVKVEWIRGRSAPNIPDLANRPLCTTGYPRPTTASIDGTGALWGLRITRMGGAENVLSRYYEWVRGQLKSEASCVLDETFPALVNYNYDADLQLTGAVNESFSNTATPLHARGYAYSNGSDRSKSLEDFKVWEYKYDSGRRLTSVLPKANCFNSGCNSWNSSWDRRDLAYDGDGRVIRIDEARLPPKPVGTGRLLIDVPQYGRSLVLTPDDGYGSVYKTVSVDGATYQYLYDAHGRRRLKVYPIGDTDEYFYEGGALLEDRGQVSLTPQGHIAYTPDLVLNEYVWLGGMPVAVMRTRLALDFSRQSSIDCTRNDEGDACGTLYPVSDYLPKVVAMIDSSGRLAGVGEYDAFGRVNELPVRGTSHLIGHVDVPAGPPPAGSWMPFGPYQPNKDIVLTTITPPTTSPSQRLKMRVNYAQVNTPGTMASATDKTWIEAGGTQVAPLRDFMNRPQHYAGPMYAVTTNWFDVPANGQVDVRWVSGSQAPAPRYSGATVRSYEYRRYEVGATPTWIPLRFPGQYADAESGLFENWNRFYDPSTGRYTASDPLLSKAALEAATPYAYAANNPLKRTDPAATDWIEYDGSKIRWHVTKTVHAVIRGPDGPKDIYVEVETGMFEWSAESGGASMNYEAIPDGEYWTSSTEKEDRTNKSGDWGLPPSRYSYRLHESILTGLKRRLFNAGHSGGYAIHGGVNPGSAGCIQVGCTNSSDPQQQEFRDFSERLDTYRGPIRVVVKKERR